MLQATRTFMQRSLAMFVELEGFDRAMALAGQAFAALLPLLIVAAAASPVGGRELGTRMINLFDLSGGAAASVREAVAQPAAIQDGISLLGMLVLVVSALAFTRALQRLYERAWRLSSLGVRGNEYGFIWLFAFILYLGLNPATNSAVHGVAGLLIRTALASAFWLVTPWLLLARRVSWRRLLPQAVLTSVGLSSLYVASAIYMPHAVSASAGQFGAIGVAFALLSWLFIAGLVLVVAAALGTALVPPTESPGKRPGVSPAG
jgi:membrane protein